MDASIGTANEGALHAALKARLAQPGDLLESRVDSYIVDIVRGDLLIEVQTRHFGSLKRKLAALLTSHRVELVYPIPVLKWIIQVDPADGHELGRRRSPKRGQLADLFNELMRIPELIDHPNLTLVVALTREEDVRCADGQGSWRRGGVSLVERRLVEIESLARFSGSRDLLTLLPPDLEQPFTTRTLSRQMGVRIAQARRVAYCLRKLGLVTLVGMDGHAQVYRLAGVQRRHTAMTIMIQEIGPEQLARYEQVSIAFEVRSILRVQQIEYGMGGLLLCEEAVGVPYVKDYDNEEEGDRPCVWPERFDVRRWAFFLAVEGESPVGAAAVAFDTPGVNMLAGRQDLAVLWDIRVHPDHRRQGIGQALLRHAVRWAQERHCTQLKIETQNINVNACRFYRAQGCHLGEINRYAYRAHPKLAQETMLIWYLDL